MSELLTTGQLVDKLKVGRLAEVVESDIPDWIGSIVEAKTHSWQWTLKNGASEEFYLSKHAQKCKWRIIPSYVNFVEALGAFLEGKTIIYKHPDGEDYDRYFNRNGMGFKVRYEFAELLNGKWIIED